jgi:hypothetical protein
MRELLTRPSPPGDIRNCAKRPSPRPRVRQCPRVPAGATLQEIDKSLELSNERQMS